MELSSLALFIIIVSGGIYLLSRKRGTKIAQTNRLSFRPGYYAWYATIWCSVPALVVWCGWYYLSTHIIEWLVTQQMPGMDSEFERSILQRDLLAMIEGHLPVTAEFSGLIETYHNLEATSAAAATVLIITLVIGGAAWGLNRNPGLFNARKSVEKFIKSLLFVSSTVSVITTIGIVLSVLFESIKFFQQISISEFLFGLKWSPQIAIRAGQMGSTGAFGSVPLLAGTMLISAIAMLVAVPVGLMSAIYLSEYASKRVRTIIKPTMELLSGIPTIVYGFFAILTLAPLVRYAGSLVGIEVASESALAAGLAMGIMIIPFISSLSDDVICAVPQALREGSYSLGATRSETIIKIVLPAALPGIVSSILLAVSRAIGETMIVVMAAGMAANLTANPLAAVTTITVQIVGVITGDQMFDSAKTLSAFALGLQLFCITLMLNVIALTMVRRYREHYE